MPTPTLVVRMPSDLREMAEAKAKEERRSLSDVVKSALRQYVTGQDGGEAYTRILARADRAEAEASRLRAELEAARRGVLRARATEAERKARADFAAGRDGRLAAYLEAATRENPATPTGGAAASGYSYYWSRNLMRALAAAGHAEKIADGRYVPVPGADIRDGLREARVLAQAGAARIAPSRRGGGSGTSPAPAPVVAAGEVLDAPEGTIAAKGNGRSGTAAEKRGVAKSPRPVAARGRQAVITELRERVPDLVTASELAAPVFLAGPDVDCAHGNMRIRKGVCPDCKQWVTK